MTVRSAHTHNALVTALPHTSAAATTSWQPAKPPSPCAHQCSTAPGVGQASHGAGPGLTHPTASCSQMFLPPQHCQQHPSFTAVPRTWLHAPPGARGMPQDCSIPMPRGTAWPQPLLTDGYMTLPGAPGWKHTHPHPNPPAVLPFTWRAEPCCTHFPGVLHGNELQPPPTKGAKKRCTLPHTVQIPSSAALSKETPKSTLLSSTIRSCSGLAQHYKDVQHQLQDK